MAKKEVVIEIKLEDRTAFQKLGALETQIKADAAELKNLNKQIVENGVATAEDVQQIGELTAALKDNRSQSRELSNELGNLTSRGERFRDKMAQATLEAIRNSGALGQLDAKATALAQEITRVNAAFTKGEVNAEEYRKTINRLEGELNQTKAAADEAQVKFNALEKEFKEGKISADQFRKSADSLNAELQTQGTAIVGAVNSLKTYALGIIGVTAAIAAVRAVVSDAAKTVVEFDTAITKISALGGEYAANIDKISAAAQEVGIRFGFAATETAGAIDELARAGLTVDQILTGGLESAFTLAVAGSISIADAAAAIATGLNQFNIAAEESARVSDALVNGANAAQGGVDQLSQALNQSALAASGLGIPIEETIGALTTFASAGLLGSDAGTSFRTMLVRLQNPTKESATLLKQYNIEAFDLKGNFVGVSDLAEQLQTKLGGLTQEQRAAALAQIFGSDALRAANVLYTEGAEGVDKYTSAVGVSGSALEKAEAQQKSLKGTLEQLGATYDAFILGIESGDGAISQAFTRLANLASDILGYFIEINKQGEILGNDGAGEGSLLRQEKGVQALRTEVEKLIATKLEAQGIDRAAFKAQGEAAFLSDEQLKSARELTRVTIERAKASGTLEDVEKKLVNTFTTAEEGTAKWALAGVQLNLVREAMKQSAAELAKAELDVVAAGKEVTTTTEGETDATVKSTKATDDKAAALAALVAEMKALASQDATRMEPISSVDIATPDKLSTEETLLRFGIDPNAPTIIQGQVEIIDAILNEQRVNQIQGIRDFDNERILLDQEFYGQKSMTQAEYNARLDVLQKEEQQLMLESQTAALDGISNFLGALQGLVSQGSEQFKALATTQALINTYLGAAQVLGTPTVLPEPFGTISKIANFAAVIATGLGAVRRIQGFAEGGFTGRGDKYEPAGIVHKGEYVVPKSIVQDKRYADLLNALEERRVKGYAQGGAVRSVGRRYSKGTAVVNGRTENVPRPSPNTLLSVQQVAEARSFDQTIVARISEINSVQGRTMNISELSRA